MAQLNDQIAPDVPPQVFFGDEELEQRVTDLTLAAKRQPLISALVPDGPAFYLLFAQPCAQPTPGFDGLLGGYCRGTRALYSGSAVDMPGRLSRYLSRRSFGGAKGLPVERIWIAVVPTRTHAAALYGEAIWIPRCPWNRFELGGAGSRQQGKPRQRHQRVQPWARLWPREWDGLAPPAAVAATMLAMAARAVEPPPPGPAWAPLPLAGSPVGLGPIAVGGVREGAIEDPRGEVAEPLVGQTGQGSAVRLHRPRCAS